MIKTSFIQLIDGTLTGTTTPNQVMPLKYFSFPKASGMEPHHQIV